MLSTHVEKGDEMTDTTRRILITGASRGIGAHLATDLASSGHTVFAASRSGRSPETPHAEDFSGTIVPITMDVTDEVSVALALADSDRLDTVICNAGVAWFAPLEIMSEASFDATIATNLTGAVRVVRHALRLLRHSGDGRVIAISTLAAISGLPGEAAYCASKAGLEAAMESLRYEVEPLGVRVSIIQPGYTADSGLVVSDVAPGTPGGTVYEPLIALNDAGHDRLRASAESPQLICDAVADALSAENPSLRYALGALAETATTLRHAPDHEVHATVSEMFDLRDWACGVAR